MKRELNVIADKVMPAKSDGISTPGSLNREEKTRTNEKLAWIRDTFHTPPPETMPELPVLLFVRSDTPSHDRIIIDYPRKKESTESSKSATNGYNTSDDKYYDIHVKSYETSNLLDNEQ